MMNFGRLNMVRESKDHGPWNSWNRVPYITTLRNGTASIVPADRKIHHNVSKNDEFCIQNEKLCIKNEESCIQNDEICSSSSRTTTARERSTQMTAARTTKSTRTSSRTAPTA